MKSSFRLFFLSMIVLVSSCSEDVNSDEVETESIWTAMKVIGFSDNTSRVEVELNRRTFDGDNLVLVNGDQVTATTQGETKVLEFDDDFFDVDYNARFNSNVEDGLYRISLSRPSNNISAPNSTVRLPRKFTLIQPFNGASYDSNGTVAVNWSNTRVGESIGLISSLACRSVSDTQLSNTNFITVDDNGFYEMDLSARAIFSNPELDKSRNCSLDVKLNRSQEGVLDPIYDGGYIRAFQEREIVNLLVRIVE